MTFSELINQDKPVLIDFFAEWCGPCKTMKPILADLKNQVGDSAVIYKIDVDKNPAIAQQFQVMSIPTLMVFRKGEVKWRKTGVASSSELKKVLQSV